MVEALLHQSYMFLMKIALLTIHSALNYGALLQATAIYDTLYSLENDTTLLNFRFPPFCSIVDKTRRRELRNCKNFLRFCVKGCSIYKKKKRFDLFISKHFHKITNEFNTEEQLKKYCEEHNFDLFVCGSDQIWNPYNIRFEKAFFLSFANEGARKISYAASIGQDTVQEDGLEFIKKNLVDFDAISVREDSAIRILREAEIKQEVFVHIDPVFLLSQNSWRERENIVSLPKSCKKYVLVYRLTNNPQFDKALEELKRSSGLPFVAITDRLGNIPFIDKKYMSVGPAEFLYLIDNAEYVITDSFHGTAFSLIFEKKLIAVSNLTKNTRITTILKKTGMIDCLVSQNSSTDIIPKLDYSKMYSRCRSQIMKLSQEARQYLEKQVNNQNMAGEKDV